MPYTRRRYRRRYTRRYTRRRTSTRGLQRQITAIKRKLDAEVKKSDAAIALQTNSFTQSTSSTNSKSYYYGFPIFSDTTSEFQEQGIQLDDIIGQQIRTKYLYLAFHATQPASTTTQTSQAPIRYRVIVFQDRNFSDGPLTQGNMVESLFGAPSTYSSSNTYANATDLTLLPLNPLQVGRFRILYDKSMVTSPSGKQDSLRKVYIRQKSFLSQGRIYFGAQELVGTVAPAGDQNITTGINRNNIYCLILRHSSDTPVSNFNIQMRYAYYDN